MFSQRESSPQVCHPHLHLQRKTEEGHSQDHLRGHTASWAASAWDALSRKRLPDLLQQLVTTGRPKMPFSVSKCHRKETKCYPELQSPIQHHPTARNRPPDGTWRPGQGDSALALPAHSWGLLDRNFTSRGSCLHGEQKHSRDYL